MDFLNSLFGEAEADAGVEDEVHRALVLNHGTYQHLCIKNYLWRFGFSYLANSQRAL